MGYRLINHQRIILQMKGDLDKLRAIADYQFGNGAGDLLFPKNVWIEYSKNTSRNKFIFHFSSKLNIKYIWKFFNQQGVYGFSKQRRGKTSAFNLDIFSAF